MSSSLAQLFEQLGSSNASLRKQAAHELVKLHASEVVEVMIKWLRSSDDTAQVTAAEILGEIGNEQAVDGLIEAFHGKTYRFVTTREGSPGRYFMIIEGAAKALGQIGSAKAVEVLFNAITVNDEFQVAGAVVGLSYVKGERVFHALIQVLHNDSHLVRYHATLALGRIGDARAVQPLMDMLQDPSIVIQAVAAEALGNLKDLGLG